MNSLSKCPKSAQGSTSHLMQALQGEREELELKLAGCPDKVSKAHLQRDIWAIFGVQEFGLKSDKLQEIASRFSEIRKVPKDYPKTI